MEKGFTDKAANLPSVTTILIYGLYCYGQFAKNTRSYSMKR
jgi:hypothetical protein